MCTTSEFWSNQVWHLSSQCFFTSKGVLQPSQATQNSVLVSWFYEAKHKASFQAHLFLQYLTKPLTRPWWGLWWRKLISNVREEKSKISRPVPLLGAEGRPWSRRKSSFRTSWRRSARQKESTRRPFRRMSGRWLQRFQVTSLNYFHSKNYS